MSMLLEPITAVWSSIGEVLGVEDGRVGVLEDPDAGLEQEPVVGVLGVGHHELLTLFADEQLDGHPALGGGGDGVEQ